MASTQSQKSSTKSARGGRKAPVTGGGRTTTVDAIELLKQDHRQVEAWFEAFEDAEDDDRKQELADDICKALTVHTQIEEEIFYPAFLEASDDEDTHHEAVIEHDGAKKLIAEIMASDPSDEYFDARVKVLSEMIQHHVKEEEGPGGMFAEAKKAELDLAELGAEMEKRKIELMDDAETDAGYDAAADGETEDEDDDEDEAEDDDDAPTTRQ